MPRPKRLIISIGIVGLVVAILAYLGVSVAAAGQITQPYHVSPAATAARAVGHFENIDFQSRADHLHLKGWLFKVARQGNRHSAIIVHGHDTNRVNPNWGALAMS